MALPGLTQHRKFGRLARALGRVTAMGVLELIWSHAYDVVSDLIGDESDLAYLLDWRGDTRPLVVALCESGFIDEVQPGMFVVHDLWDHCPLYVKRRRARRGCTRGTEVNAVPGLAFPQEQKNEEQRLSPPPRPVENEKPNVRVLLRLAHELHGESFETVADFKEAFKRAAAKHRLAYDAASIAKVIELMRHSRRPLDVLLDECREATGG